MKSVAIIASTLPLPFLVRTAEIEKVKTIYVCSDELFRSCLELKNHWNGVKIKKVPIGFYLKNLFWFFLIVKSKFLNQRLIFFHECCMPFFDLFLSFVKPKAKFFPQVTMEGSIEIDLERMPKSKVISFLDFFGFTKRFTFYLSPSVGQNSEEFVLRYRSYPKSVEVYSVLYSRSLLYENSNQLIDLHCNRILILLGKGMVADENQIKVFSSIIDILKKFNFDVYIKDHPNPKFRLNFDSKIVTHLPNEVPAELAGIQFSWVIGFSSTAIINFGNRGISILNFLQGVSKENYDLVKKHFDEIDPNHSILYPKNMEELVNILGKQI